MKNTIKLFEANRSMALFVFIAVIGFSILSCASTPPVPPIPPTGVTIEERILANDPLRPRGLIITWTAVEGADGYTVLLNEGTRSLPSTNAAAGQTRVSLAVENGGIEYSVQIIAIKGSGRKEARSAASESVTITTTLLTSAEKVTSCDG